MAEFTPQNLTQNLPAAHRKPDESNLVERLFTDHPKAVNETYFEHLCAASSFAGGLLVCAFCCFVHAIVPGFFTTSASARVERMHERMHNRS